MTRAVSWGAEPGPPGPRRWRVLAVAVLVGGMALLDVTVVYVAIPSMRAGLDASVGAVQWIVSGYALAYGLTLVAGGRLGDLFGRRRMMLIGLTGFVASSAIVSLAPTIGVAIAARVAQGVSAGLLTPQNWGLVQDLFSGEERGRAFGVVATALSVSSALGPLVGGGVIALAGDELGWRLVFLLNVPLGLVAVAAVAKVVPSADRSVAHTSALTLAGRLDLSGSALLGAAVLCLLLPLSSIQNGPGWPLLVLVGAPLLLWAFARREVRVRARGHEPLLDLALLRRLPGYGIGLGIAFAYFVGLSEIFLVLSVHLQDEVGESAATTGLLLAPFAIGSTVSAPWSGRLVARFRRRLIVAAIGVIAVTTLALGLAGPQISERSLLVLVPALLLVAGVAGGVAVAPNFTLTLAAVPPRMGGAAGGALETAQRVGSSVGAAVLLTTYGVTSASTTPERGLQAALLVSTALLCLALALALHADRQDRPADLSPAGTRPPT